MGRIVLHAGMPKTGSSSIQGWLRDSDEQLRAEWGVTPLRARVHPSGDLRLIVNDDRKLVNAGKVFQLYEERRSERAAIVAEFLGRLDRKARSHGTVVISAERFADWFWQRDEMFAGAIDELAAAHELEIAYYVRPQHTALEAAWRQWGFRDDAPPSEFLAARSEHFDYLGTLAFMHDAAPRVRFTPRPFRRDLLAGGNVVVDFARAFLGIELASAHDPELWRNRGLPLELVNALHGVPPGTFWEIDVAEQVNPVLDQLRALTADLDLPTSDEIRLSRLVLQQACHERFEPDNLRLIAELGWETDEWVPAVQEEVGEATFERLDELWRPRASAAELEVLRGALAELIAADGTGSAPDPVAAPR